MAGADGSGVPGTGPPATNVVPDMLRFINAAWTPFHAVEEASKMLSTAGFTHIAERDAWDLQPGGKYYFTKNMSTIVAFAVGAKYQPGNGFYMVGAHTDSPCLKLKPVSKSSRGGCLLVNVETYGGGLWTTWFDRDLSVAGRVLVRTADGKLAHKLVKVERPIMRIPMLAIHLQRDINSKGFQPNTQKHLAPVLATEIKAQLDSAKKGDKEGRHHSALVALVAEHVGCAADDVVDFELHVCDTQPGTVAGLKEEFVFVGRLDNLAMSYVALAALIESCAAGDALADEEQVRAIALFDHEECGSDSAQGAGGPVMRDTITRVARSLAGPDAAEGVVSRCLARSFLVSADMAHALHPNYTDVHDPELKPHFHGGLVLKYNGNQRYASNLVSGVLFREVARRTGIPCQEFAVRNDMPCGSTIGPILSSSLGCRTVDVGAPQWSMHSIREVCGVDDVNFAFEHFAAFFRDFGAVDALLDVDALPPPSIQGTITDTPCEHTH